MQRVVTMISTTPTALYSRDISRALRKLRLIARNSDWFIPLFVALVVIGRINYFGVSLCTVIEKALYVVIPNVIPKLIRCDQN